MALYPGAKHRLIGRHNGASTKPMAAYNRMNLHVAVSEAPSLFGFFSGSPLCSHFYVAKNGVVEQYIDTAFRSRADGEGNDATISVETQGGVTNSNGEPWTIEQVISLAKLFAWAAATHGIQLKLATSSKVGAESKGLSWHRLGCNGNFPALPSILAGREQRGGGMLYSPSRGKICPGAGKIEQIPGILARAAGGETPAAALPPAPGPANDALYTVVKGDTLYSIARRVGMTVSNLATLNGNPKVISVGQKLKLAGSKVAPAVVAAPTQTNGTITVKYGDKGAAVLRLQKFLNRMYPAYIKISEDGIFLGETDRAVRAVQRRLKVVVDGVPGPTFRRLTGFKG